MRIDYFDLEHMQRLFERAVDYTLSESDVLPLKLSELLDSHGDDGLFLNQELWYCESDGSPLLQERIAHFYPDRNPSTLPI